jgi:DNA-binding CsgD family transcriptional regulator
VGPVGPRPTTAGLTVKGARCARRHYLLVDARSNPEIALVVAQRAVATHIEHILVELGTTSRTLAAVRQNG